MASRNGRPGSGFCQEWTAKTGKVKKLLEKNLEQNFYLQKLFLTGREYSGKIKFWNNVENTRCKGQNKLFIRFM